MTTPSSEHENLVEIGCSEVHRHYEDIRKTDTAVWRKNARGEFVIVRAEMLEQLFANKAWDKTFYIDNQWSRRIRNEEEPPKIEADTESVPVESANGADRAEDTDTGTSAVRSNVFSSRMEKIESKSIAERIQILDANISRLNERNKSSDAKPVEIIKECIKIVTDFFMISLTTIREQQKEGANEGEIRSIIEKTDLFIDEIVSLLRKQSLRYSDLNIIEKMSINSQTFDHVSKVFLRYILFGFFYDRYFQDGTINAVIDNLKEFKPHYDRLQETRTLTLEDIGLERISKNAMKRYTLGVLLHDVGKFLNIDYHEGNLPYNREKVVGHAALGYNLLVKTRVIPQDVAAIAALHHEYYGDNTGYGVSRFLFPVVKEKMKNPRPVFNSFMSMNFEDVKNGRSRSYFPAKVLEIHDIFDGLTNRSKAHPHSWREALDIMHDDFIEKAVKIDPVLFHIFREFITVYMNGK